MTNFFDALDILEDQDARHEIFFRLYYDPETKAPLFYSMEDKPGDYITITALQFAELRYDILVKDGKIETVRAVSIGKLVPSLIARYGTLKADVSIVGDEQYWNMKTYE